jgi:hypothetical protein
MLTEGVWAEAKVGGEHLRLFSEHNVQGVQASVYNVNSKAWIAPSESVDDIEQGRIHARAYPETSRFRIAVAEVEESSLAIAFSLFFPRTQPSMHCRI